MAPCLFARGGLGGQKVDSDNDIPQLLQSHLAPR